MARCPLCEREVPRLTEHHLVPRQVGRRRGQRTEDLPTVDLCPACHRMVHRLIDNGALARDYGTVEALRAHPEVQKFVAWVQKQPPERHVRIRR